ncbi:unnamed protein product [Amoebophrya sp. A120]|nr:unnamed protein product [Amoebophrya sp. A120]|eukprot:GSA120T00002123001.1
MATSKAGKGSQEAAPVSASSTKGKGSRAGAAAPTEGDKKKGTGHGAVAQEDTARPANADKKGDKWQSALHGESSELLNRKREDAFSNFNFTSSSTGRHRRRQQMQRYTKTWSESANTYVWSDGKTYWVWDYDKWTWKMLDKTPEDMASRASTTGVAGKEGRKKDTEQADQSTRRTDQDSVDALAEQMGNMSLGGGSAPSTQTTKVDHSGPKRSIERGDEQGADEPRPESTVVPARRMILTNLGIRLTPEQRKEEIEFWKETERRKRNARSSNANAEKKTDDTKTETNDESGK